MATVTDVPPDQTAGDVLEVVVGAVVAQANLLVTIDNPEPVFGVAANNSGATYQFAAPIQDVADPTVWTVDITVSA